MSFPLVIDAVRALLVSYRTLALALANFGATHRLKVASQYLVSVPSLFEPAPRLEVTDHAELGKQRLRAAESK